MGFRTVVIGARSRCELRLGYLVIRKGFDDEQRIFLDEVSVLLFTNTAVSCTLNLLSECAKKNIKVIICDDKYTPCGEVMSYQSNSDVVRRSREQFSWQSEAKGEVWREIVKSKIMNQSGVMAELGFDEISAQLVSFASNVDFDDMSNREGHAAKVYFNNYLPDGIQRHQGGLLNSCLDYGYTILLSLFNQSVVASGYLAEIGIHHRSENNPFNFSCDLMEPFRFIVDSLAKSYEKMAGEDMSFFKKHMHKIFYAKIKLSDGKSYELFTAITEYTRSVLRSLSSGNAGFIKFPVEYSLLDGRKE